MRKTYGKLWEIWEKCIFIVPTKTVKLKQQRNVHQKLGGQNCGRKFNSKTWIAKIKQQKVVWQKFCDKKLKWLGMGVGWSAILCHAAADAFKKSTTILLCFSFVVDFSFHLQRDSFKNFDKMWAISKLDHLVRLVTCFTSANDQAYSTPFISHKLRK